MEVQGDLFALLFCQNPARAWDGGMEGGSPNAPRSEKDCHLSTCHILVLVPSQPLPPQPWLLHHSPCHSPRCPVPCNARQRKTQGSHQEVGGGEGRYRSSLPCEFPHGVGVGETGKQKQDLSQGPTSSCLAIHSPPLILTRHGDPWWNPGRGWGAV